VSELPAAVRQFLDQHIFSASQLETLLLLHARAGQPVTTAEAARDLRLPVSALTPWLEAFAQRGLLEQDDGAYCFQPQDPALAAAVDEVASAYERRRTTVSRYLYARGQDPLTRFADAFRLRRGPAPTTEEDS
jgi:hypothetical protein